MRPRPWRWILLFLLLGSALGWSTWRAFDRSLGSAAEQTTLRFAHFQLESGLREAFDDIIVRYEAEQARRGRTVRVEQVAIPSRLYPTWARTQLVGGTAPDIMINSFGIDDELRARSFRRLGDVIEAPNPYNEGTPLAGKRWRETFVDGMEISGFDFVLMDHYSVPYTTVTTRLFVNRSLLNEVLALPENAPLAAELGQAPPRSLRQFFELFNAVEAFGAARGQSLVPLSSSRDNGELAVGRIFSALTQELVSRRAPYDDWRLPRIPQVVDYLQGGWSWDEPGVRAGLTLVRELASHMPAGYPQLQRDDAVFYFAQGQALAIPGGSWDAPTLKSQAAGRFEVEIWPLPQPDPADPAYGAFVVGPISEADAVPFGALGVLQQAPEKMALAIDFLQFLTSYEGNARFSARSGWLPAVVGVEPAPELVPFMPRGEGYPRGLPLQDHTPDLRRAVDTHLHRLIAQDGSVDSFIGAVTPAYAEAARLYLRLAVRDVQPQLRRQDLMIEAYQRTQDERRGVLLEMQQEKELEYWQARGELLRP